jgi:tryptophan synthase alpha chain
MRKFSSLPIAVGFGISNARQVADVKRYADAVVVGSAIVAEMERLNGAADLAEQLGQFADGLQDLQD